MSLFSIKVRETVFLLFTLCSFMIKVAWLKQNVFHSENIPIISHKIAKATMEFSLHSDPCHQASRVLLRKCSVTLL